MLLRAPHLAITVLALVISAFPVWAPESAAAAPAAAATTTRSISVANGDFNQGTRRWKVVSSSPVRFARHPGRSGPGVRIKNRRKSRVIRLTHTVNTVSHSRRSDRYSVSAWVRTSQPMRVALRVDERHNDRHRTRQKGHAVRAGRWQRISLKVAPRFSGSSLRVAVAGLGVRKGTTMRVDNVQVKRTRTSATVTAPPCRRAIRGLPRCGAYVGAAYGGNGDVRPMERQVGGRLAVHRTFFRANQVDWAIRTARQDLDAGMRPWISFKFPHNWSDMAKGRGNAWARDIAQRLARLDGPVWVAFHHEPETDGNIRLWTRAQERLAPIVRSQAPNVAYSIVLMGWHQVPKAGNRAAYGLSKVWPDTKIDLLGIDPYNYYGAAGKSATAPTNIVGKYFKPISRWAARNNVSWGVAEIGYTNRTLAEDPDWLQRTHRGLVAHNGVALSYFNSSINSVADWRLDTPADFRAFNEILTSSPRPAS